MLTPPRNHTPASHGTHPLANSWFQPGLMARFVFCWFFFACGCQVAFVEKAIFAPLCCLWSLVKDQLTLFMWVCLTLYSVPLISVPFASTTLSVALYSVLKSGSICLPTLSFFNIMLAILGLSFHRKFTISGLLHKITCWNFDICCKWKVLSTPVVFFPFIYRNHF